MRHFYSVLLFLSMFFSFNACANAADKVFFVTNRAFVAGEHEDFGSDVSMTNNYGFANIDVAKSKNPVLSLTKNTSPGDFFREYRLSCGGSNRTLIFIHGYNTSFKDALINANKLQQAFHLPVLLYSWPSFGKFGPELDDIRKDFKVLGCPLTHYYDGDKSHIRQSIGALKAFLAQVDKADDPGNVTIIAHSMGNDLLTFALKERFAAKTGFGGFYNNPDVSEDIAQIRSNLDASKENLRWHWPSYANQLSKDSQANMIELLRLREKYQTGSEYRMIVFYEADTSLAEFNQNFVEYLCSASEILQIFNPQDGALDASKTVNSDIRLGQDLLPLWEKGVDWYKSINCSLVANKNEHLHTIPAAILVSLVNSGGRDAGANYDVQLQTDSNSVYYNIVKAGEPDKSRHGLGSVTKE